MATMDTDASREGEWRLSIDFGTSNTAAAVVRGSGSVFVLRLGTQSDSMPSSVAVYGGELVVGEGAQRVAGIQRDAFEATPKRRLGEHAVLLAGTLYDPVDLVAAVLRHVVSLASRYMGGGMPSSVVLTHPDAWSSYLRSKLSEAAAKAGISPERQVLMPEPVAAAWHYAALSDVPPGARLAVLDFGGGTCDAAVLGFDVVDGRPRVSVLASQGIDPLGGHDFDAQLEEWVRNQLRADKREAILAALAAPEGAGARATLREQVREAKHALSYHSSAPIAVRAGGDEYVCTVTRAEFEQLIGVELERAAELLRRTVAAAEVELPALHKIYLTGGSSLIPALHARVAEALGVRLDLLGDPKQITSIGALQAPVLTQPPLVAPASDPRRWAGVGGSAQPPGLPPRPVQPQMPAPGLAGQGAPGLAAASLPRQASDEDSARGRAQLSPAKVALFASLGVAALALVTALMIFAPWRTTGGTAGAGDGTSGTTSSPTSPTAATATPAYCAATGTSLLTRDECALVEKAEAWENHFDPSTCESEGDLDLADRAVVCEANAGSGQMAGEDFFVWIYGFDRASDATTSFDGIVSRYGAAQRDLADAPAWDEWAHTSDSSSTVRGRILTAETDKSSVLVWTEDATRIEVWALADPGTGADLVDWWAER